MTTPRTIVAQASFEYAHVEGIASGTLKPGHLLQKTTATKDTYTVHSTRGGLHGGYVLKENYLLGKTVTDAYTSGENGLLIHQMKSGQKFNMRLHAYESVTKNDWLISYGDGTLCKAQTSQFLTLNTAASTTITNTVAETTFSNGTSTIKKNTLKAGDQVRIRGTAKVLSANSTDTLQVKVLLGATALVTTAALDITTGDYVSFDAVVTLRTIGASGTFVSDGSYTIGVEGTATEKADITDSTAIDTTADIDITVTATFSVAHANNQVRLETFMVEQVEAGTPFATGHLVGQADETVNNSAGTDDAWICVVAA